MWILGYRRSHLVKWLSSNYAGGRFEASGTKDWRYFPLGSESPDSATSANELRLQLTSAPRRQLRLRLARTASQRPGTQDREANTQGKRCIAIAWSDAQTETQTKKTQ